MYTTHTHTYTHIHTYTYHTTLHSRTHTCMHHTHTCTHTTHKIHKYTHTLHHIHTHSLDPNIKAVVYSAGIALGTEEDWNFMWNKFLAETDPYEKGLYINALAQSTQVSILNRYISLVSRKGVGSQVEEL